MTKGKIIIMAINFYRGITTEMYRVSKVLNNNGVIAIDMDENKEYVILGKGVGFGKRSASVLISRRDALHIVWNRRQSVDLRRNW